ncbi:ATP-binding protein, partial [Paenibacillus sp. GYB004]|uniref:ATP-binding protein n=1 Tax=Paenibacillus sp. GYB004 TaxID=2994393 RepID=UPI002F96B89F
MKKILLDSLTIRNFKGFREFVLMANGGNLDVYGDNATGKTTLFDGFTWHLFGKDSTNSTTFEIKELDPAGKV